MGDTKKVNADSSRRAVSFSEEEQWMHPILQPTSGYGYSCISVGKQNKRLVRAVRSWVGVVRGEAGLRSDARGWRLW